MNEYHYTEIDRKSQLAALRQALVELIPVAKSTGVPQSAAYERALAETGRLIARGFVQEELTSLSRMVPDVVLRHKDWESQLLVRNADGRWVFPKWFEELECKLQPALKAAGVLAVLGYY
jgi:hypothetical protein